MVHRLLEHEQFKNAAEMLNSKRLLEDAMWSQPGIGEFAEAEDEPGLVVSVFDLISVFREILERAKKRPQLQIQREEVTVAQMVEHVKQVLRTSPGPVPLDGFDRRLSLAAGVDRPVPGIAGDGTVARCPASAKGFICLDHGRPEQEV